MHMMMFNLSTICVHSWPLISTNSLQPGVIYLTKNYLPLSTIYNNLKILNIRIQECNQLEGQSQAPSNGFNFEVEHFKPTFNLQASVVDFHINTWLRTLDFHIPHILS